MTLTTHVAWHAMNAHGALSYRLRHARRGFDWQQWPAGDLPDDIARIERGRRAGGDQPRRLTLKPRKAGGKAAQTGSYARLKGPRRRGRSPAAVDTDVGPKAMHRAQLLRQLVLDSQYVVDEELVAAAILARARPAAWFRRGRLPQRRARPAGALLPPDQAGTLVPTLQPAARTRRVAPPRRAGPELSAAMLRVARPIVAELLDKEHRAGTGPASSERA